MEDKNKEVELTGDELLAAIKENGLSKSFQAYIQKYSDQKVSEGLKTREKNIQAKNLTDSEKIANLEAELKEIKDINLKSTLNNSIKDSLKAAGLSEGFLKFIRVDKEEDIELAVKDLNDNILGLKQSDIDNKLKGDLPPLKGDLTSAGSGMETAVKEFAKKISPKE